MLRKVRSTASTNLEYWIALSSIEFEEEMLMIIPETVNYCETCKDTSMSNQMSPITTDACQSLETDDRLADTGQINLGAALSVIKFTSCKYADEIIAKKLATYEKVTKGNVSITTELAEPLDYFTKTFEEEFITARVPAGGLV